MGWWRGDQLGEEGRARWPGAKACHWRALLHVCTPAGAHYCMRLGVHFSSTISGAVAKKKSSTSKSGVQKTHAR